MDVAPPPDGAGQSPRGCRLALVLLSLAVVPLLALGFAADVLLGLPPRSAVKELARKNPPSTAMMREREDEARKTGKPQRRVQAFVPISRIGRPLLRAVITSEDPNFFSHRGIDWNELRESFRIDLRLGRFFRGGSTITQQLAKNLFLSRRKSVVRKAREMIIARWLEADLGKARILELYLNVIEFGDGVWGCEAASRLYYGHSAAELSTDEAAGLAAIIPSPLRLNPLRNPAGYTRVQKRVLFLMEKRPDILRSLGSLGSSAPEEPEPQDSSPGV
jgi:monofunctional biosynthetic peptidoglycan transglycosylase